MAITALQAVRYVGNIEGVSYLLLLGIAMPIKYIGKNPDPVLYVGWAHGVLFMLYAVVAFGAFFAKKLPFKYLVGAAIASLLPFGPYVIDPKLRKLETQNAEAATGK